MADVKISALTAADALADSVVPASDASATATRKVTCQSIANLAQLDQIGAIGSDTTAANGGTAIANLVVITQTDYDALVTAGTVDNTTVYLVQ